jgi:zinc transport system substrate-binding protein
MKKYIFAAFAAFICLAVILFIVKMKNPMPQESQKLKIIATIYPQYDFIRQIAGDLVELEILLPPGSESHSFEPRPQDIIKIKNADIFIWTGGESEAWVEKVLESTEGKERKIVSLLDLVKPLKEEIVEGMEEEEGEEEEGEALDEHVWTSPKNAQIIVLALRDILSKADPENAKTYEKNTAELAKKLDKLDEDFSDMVKQAKRKTIVIGDRFPFRYLAQRYGIKYYAAFPGCSAQTQASAHTIAFLIDKVKAEKIPIVFYIEFSNEKIADVIIEKTDAKKALLHSAHNVSKKDFENKVSYLDLMNRNLSALKDALWL